ncbi:MAG: DUF167 domain-containing protein [Candidatus Azambacteria bacterium]|nr:DUF167 domain-containing protein [Candidatus Azambacteria bacterium]
MKIFVKVKPSAQEESIKKRSETNFEICVKEPPVKGKANTAVIKVLARHFGVPISSVNIIIGHSSRQKIIEIK